MRELAWLPATGAQLKAMTTYIGDRIAYWMRAGPKLHNGYGRLFFTAGKAELVCREYSILHGIADYICPLELKHMKIIFFVRQAT